MRHSTKTSVPLTLLPVVLPAALRPTEPDCDPAGQPVRIPAGPEVLAVTPARPGGLRSLCRGERGGT